MPDHELTFIRISPGESKGAQNLEERKAKSHAAYVGFREHQARKRSVKATKSPRPRPNVEVIRLNGEDSTIEDDERREAETHGARTNGTLDLVASSRRQPTLSLNFEAFRGLRTDPFLRNADGNRVGSTDGALIDFFARDIGPINAAVGWVFNVASIASGMLEILSQERFYDALLCTLEEMKDQVQSQSAGTAPSTGVLRRKGRAMARVREGLQDRTGHDIEEATLCAIVLLAVVEGRFQAPAVRELHKRTITALTERRGGLRNFRDGSVFKTSVMQFDTFWTWETGATMFPGQRRSHEPLYPSNPGSMKLIQDLPTGFQDLFTEGILSYDILPVLSRASQFCNLSIAQRAEFLEKARRQPRGFNDFWEACPCLGLEDGKYHLLERLVTMSVLYFIYGTFVPRAFPTGPGGPTPDLTSKLMSYQPASKAEEACVQWMWIEAIDLMWTGTQYSSDDCFSMLQLQLRYPEFCTVDAVLKLGARFLWTKEISKTVPLYWKDVANPILMA